ncbi:hypothetical protein [Burkholderia perseverans]|uniref:hypothetical protein n=1 Tax=Burkholderia perseverans TaxID=2615214 RepID=UPI001FEE5EDB|nr:hypothetical protein [Burkholderia perseverans]
MHDTPRAKPRRTDRRRSQPGPAAGRRPHAGPAAAVVGPRPVADAAPYTVIALPTGAGPAAALYGVPDRVLTRCLCWGLALLLMLGVAALAAAFLGVGTQRHALGTRLALLGLTGAPLAGLALYLVHAARQAPAWVRIDAAGIHYGAGPADDGNHLEWQQLAANPVLAYDVGIRIPSAYGTYVEPRLSYWYRLPDGELVPRSMPLRLRESALRCLRFRNAAALRVALLRGMAAREDLRFDAQVFVEAGVDPWHWRALRERGGFDSGVVLAVLAVWFGGCAFALARWPIESMATIVSMVAALVVLFWGARLAITARRRARYPGYLGVFRFRRQG